MKKAAWIKKITDALLRSPAEKVILPTVFVGIIVKNILLQCFIAGSNPYTLSFFALNTPTVLGLVFSLVSATVLYVCPLLLIGKKETKIRFSLIAGGVFLALAILDVCYYRSSPELPSLSLLILLDSAATQGHLSLQSVIDTFSYADILFYLDFIFLSALFLVRRYTEKKAKTASTPEKTENAAAHEKTVKTEKTAAPEKTEKTAASALPDDETAPETAAKTEKSSTPAHRDETAPETAAKTEKSPTPARRDKSATALQDGAGSPERAAKARRFLAVFVPCILLFAVLPLFNLFGFADSVPDAYVFSYNPAYSKDLALSFTPIGYHLVDLTDTVSELLTDDDGKEDGIPEEVLSQIEEYYDYMRDDLPDNAFKGMYEGKNVILLQVESLEGCLIGQTVNGREITPNLNKLFEESASTICFTSICDQVKSGNSSDCDLMINSSILPTSKVFFHNYKEVTLPSLPSLLRGKGYSTVYFNGSGNESVWPYAEIYEKIFGYTTDQNDPACNFFLFETQNEEELIYRYISDEANFGMALEKLSEIDKSAPFFAQIVTCSSHMPFTFINEDLKKEELFFLPEDEELASSHSVSYINCQHYTDGAIGKFLDEAKAKGLLENTIVLIYGDHTGIHKYYPTDAEEAAGKCEDLSFLANGDYKTVPFIICDFSGKTEHKEIDTFGGQSDILPTLLSLLGFEKEEYSFCMGKNLLNTGRNFTVLPNGTIVGELGEDEEQFGVIYRAYATADLIAEYDYYGKRK